VASILAEDTSDFFNPDGLNRKPAEKELSPMILSDTKRNISEPQSITEWESQLGITNPYADISARYAETAPIPRFASQFYEKNADRLLYGSDMGFDRSMYQVTFRLLETLDEHFYETDMFGYHWSLNGLGLPDEILHKLYRTNAEKLLTARTK
jgi:hypothetical protein